MNVRADIHSGGLAETGIELGLVAPSGGPAATAAARVGRAGLLFGGLGAGSSLFVVSRLVETWRVSPAAASHRIAILGQSVSYPAANLAALVVLGLALMGLAVTALTVGGAFREVLAGRRLRRSIEAGAPRRLGDVQVIDDEQPRAFCAGWLRPRVYVSTGALARLDEPALGAVLAHERHHARRRDPLRFAAGRVMAHALFFLPGIAELVRRQEALAELSADESAVDAAPGNRSALARAMLSFSEASRPGDPAGIAPERVDRLLGEPASWPFPLLVCLLAAGVLAALVGIAALAGQLASGSATLAPPFLSRQPCVVVLATIPAILGLIVVSLRGGILRADGPLAPTEGAARPARARGGDHGGDLAP
jgi:BlaR1 peptidase M56